MWTFFLAMTREEYLSLLADEADLDFTYEPISIGRYNVALGIRVLLLSERTNSCISILFTGDMRQVCRIRLHR